MTRYLVGLGFILIAYILLWVVEGGNWGSYVGGVIIGFVVGWWNAKLWPNAL